MLALAVLMGLTAFGGVRVVNFGIPPFEDAAMLMRYASHLAEGHGIVWNIGEPPVDGVTDFLFMVIVALVHKFGFTIETATRFIAVLSHFATVGLIYVGMRQVQRAGIVAAFLSALFFAMGPGLFLAAAYFGTPFFVLGVAFSWLLAQRMVLSGERGIGAYVSFAGACLVTSLIRPEGVLVSVFMLAAVGILIPRKEFLRLTAVFGGIFLILGGTYFLWRWHYFGHPLPNPFYKKGGWSLYIGSLRASWLVTLSLGVPFIPIFLLAVRSKDTLIKGGAFLIPIAGSASMWVLLSNEMNFGARFQYPVLALWVLSWYPIARSLRKDFRLPASTALTTMQKISIAICFATVLGFVFKHHISNSLRITYSRDGRFDIAVMLSQYAERGYTIATTEAGLLPLYSRWRAIDTWGLNDQWIAHNGNLTLEYLSQKQPDIIMWHGFFSPQHPPPNEHYSSPWFRQVMTLKQYAEQNDFTLAAVFGLRLNDTHYYYVRSDLPEHDEIVDAIRSTSYWWFGNGKQSKNYLLQLPSGEPNAQQAAPADARASHP